MWCDLPTLSLAHIERCHTHTHSHTQTHIQTHTQTHTYTHTHTHIHIHSYRDRGTKNNLKCRSNKNFSHSSFLIRVLLSLNTTSVVKNIKVFAFLRINRIHFQSFIGFKIHSQNENEFLRWKLKIEIENFVFINWEHFYKKLVCKKLDPPRP